MDDSRPSHYDFPEKLPRGVQTTGRFDGIIGFDLVFDGSGLSFETKDGMLIPMEAVGSCEQAIEKSSMSDSFRSRNSIAQVEVHGLSLRIENSELTGMVVQDAGKTQQASVRLEQSIVVVPYAIQDNGSYYVFSETIETEDADFRSLTLIINIETEFIGGFERNTVIHEFQRASKRRILSCLEV